MVPDSSPETVHPLQLLLQHVLGGGDEVQGRHKVRGAEQELDGGLGLLHDGYQLQLLEDVAATLPAGAHSHQLQASVDQLLVCCSELVPAGEGGGRPNFISCRSSFMYLISLRSIFNSNPKFSRISLIANVSTTVL